MRRVKTNWHDRAVGTFLFVVVFLAATLIGTPHNRDGTNALSRRPSYSRTILLPGRRTLTKNEVTTDNVDEDAAEEPEEPENEADLEEKSREIEDLSNENKDPENDAEFEERSRGIDEKSPEANENSPEIDGDVSAIQDNNQTSCVLVLMKKHPEICTVADEIITFQNLFPEFRRSVMKQMGGRRFNFVFSSSRGKTVMENLYEAVRCLASCIKKFIKFIESVEGVDGATTKTPPTSPYPSGGPRFPSPVIGSYPVPDRNRSHQWWKTSEYRSNDRAVPLSDDPEEHHRVKRMDKALHASRESSKDCAASIVKVDPDACGTLAKMELLNSIMKHSNDILLQKNSLHDRQLPMNLDSDNVGLDSFLEALRESFLDAETAKLDGEAKEEPRRDPDTGDISSAHGRRHMVKGNDERIAEIFQTLDSRIEFRPQNDRSSFRNRPESWNANNFMDNRNREFETRRGPGTLHRSARVNDKKRERDVNSIATRLPAYGHVRRGKGGSVKEYVFAEKNRATSWSPQFSRSLGTKVSSRHADKEQNKGPKLFERHRRSWHRPSYSTNVIAPAKKYPQYRLGDAEKSEDSMDKEKCITEEQAKNIGWKEWAFSMFRDFSKKIFGSQK